MNTTIHRSIKMKRADVKSGIYVNIGIENNDKDPKIEVADHVIVSKYKNIFAKCYVSVILHSCKVFVIGKCGHVYSALNNEEINGTFYEKDLQKTNQTKFRIEKVIKRKVDKLYGKWKGYNNLLNDCIDKKDIYI